MPSNFYHELTQQQPPFDHRLDRRRLLSACLGGAVATLAARPVFAGPGRAWIQTNLDRANGNSFRDALLAALNLLPVVGGFLSYLGALFIPMQGETPEMRWLRLFQKIIDEATLRLVRADMIGLSDIIGLYRKAVENGNPQTILSQSIATRTVFTASLPRFMQQGQEQNLLPLFALAATLHLSLLRDMALHGLEFGMNEADVRSIREELTTRTTHYTAHVDRHVAGILARVKRENPNDGRPENANQPLAALLNETGILQLSVLDIRDTWYAFDATRHPGPTLVRLDRELITLGGRWDSRAPTPDTIPSFPRPAAPIQHIDFYLSLFARQHFLSGCSLRYADGQTLSTGTCTGARHSLALSADQSVSLFRLYFGSVAHQVDLRVGSRLHRFGAHTTPIDPVEVDPPEHRLSSVRSTGIGANTNGQHDSGYLVGFQLVDQVAKPISMQAFDEIAPRIAPRLLDWISR